ncbi:hypothetical protein IFR05_015423 [Cadophora sp. M221]|nr:hypothetical protein IFR05_015423 [Cadophora sp. M221]
MKYITSAVFCFLALATLSASAISSPRSEEVSTELIPTRSPSPSAIPHINDATPLIALPPNDAPQPNNFTQHKGGGGRGGGGGSGSRGGGAGAGSAAGGGSAGGKGQQFSLANRGASLMDPWSLSYLTVITSIMICFLSIQSLGVLLVVGMVMTVVFDV